MHETIVQISDKPVDIYAFDKPEQQNLFTKITKELRCSVCQNESLADSQAILAVDLKDIIYKQVLQQKSEQQIINFVSNRYGEFVLYQPPMNWNTAILWFGPLILLILGFYSILKLIRPK